MSEALISKRKVAEMLGVTVRTVDNYIARKMLTQVKFGTAQNACCRIKLADVQKLITPAEPPANAV